MRIAIIAIGSRGDVQPFVALGAGLQRAGHDVHIIAGNDFEAMIAEQGLAFAPVGVAFAGGKLRRK